MKMTHQNIMELFEAEAFNESDELATESREVTSLVTSILNEECARIAHENWITLLDIKYADQILAMGGN